MFAGGAVFLYFHDPRVPGITPICIFRRLSGFHCPGCGITRSVYCIMHGWFYEAFDYNPLVMILSPFVLYEFVIELFRRAKMKTPPTLFNRRGVAMVLLIILIAYWILRNLPYPPFNFLAP